MIITATAIKLNDQQAIVQICVEGGEERKVCALGSAWAQESGRYIELAQARAMVLARQILEQGLEAVSPDDFMTPPIGQEPLVAKARTTISPVVTPPPSLPTVEPVMTQPDARPQQLDVTGSGFFPDPSGLPEVPW